jgi:flagellar hook-associated protein 2
MLTIDGLATGIDTTAVIEGLLQIQQGRLDQIAARRNVIRQKQAAFATFEAQLLTLRSHAAGLARAQNGPFEKRVVTVSHEDRLTATATSSAAPGVYRLQLDALATAHQLLSGGLADPEAEITQGTLSLRVGSGSEKTITIDGTNNTLTGLVDGINAAGAGVTASILRDDTSGSPSYHILLTAHETGASQQITINNQLAASAGGATRVEFTQEVQAAGNARVILGSGAGSVTLESETNEIDGLIAGVRLNLLEAAPGETVSLTVGQDTESAVTAVEDFVASFNDVLDFVDAATRFDPATNQAALLQGNRTLYSIQDRLRGTLVDVVPGVNPAANQLAAVGITVSDTGRLVLDRTRLEDILRGDVEDVSAADLKRLFALSGTSSSAGIKYVGGSTRTQESAGPYEVDITQVAERASITGSVALAGSTIIDGTNDELLISVDGASATIQLAHGTYTNQELADHVENLINSSSELPGRAVTASLNGSLLQLTSLSYGSDSSVTIDGGTAVTALGLTVGLSDVGQDVAGTFLVNGVTESATGRGKVLTGDADNEHTADLQVRVDLPASQVVPGAEGEVTVTRGLVARLEAVLGNLLDPVTGELTTADDGFTRDLESLQRSVDRETALFEQKQQALITEFARVEALVSQLQATGSFLTAQFAGLSSLRVP